MEGLKIAKLEDFLHFEANALALIEESFQYSSPFHYSIDFFPLVKKENSSHRYILIKNETEVIGHIGVKEKILSHHQFDFKVIFLGGIAIKDSERGKGYFSLLMNEVIKTYYSDVAMMFLWSDKPDLYQKFGFELCIGQIQVSGTAEKELLERKYFKDLDWEDKKRIRDIYNKTLQEDCFSIKRNKEEWNEIEQITSAQFHLLRNKERIVAYFVKDKGKDLNNIAHEIGYEEEKYLKEMINSSAATFWLPEKFLQLWPEAPIQYGAMVKISQPDLFHDFISVWSDGEINTLNVKENIVKFLFNDEIFSLSSQEFLASVFGPYPLREFQPFNKNLYISGLDSI